MRTYAIGAAVILVLGGVVAWQATRLDTLGTSVKTLAASDARLNVEISDLAGLASTTAAASASTTAQLSELARRQTLVSNASSSQTLESAVARITPAVVSIVESQEVPQLQVTYENPFGSDPFFQGFGVEVPVYQQVGTQEQEVSAGTGFIVASGGYIVTNKHVVPDSDATYTVLLASGKQVPATVLWRSPTEDLAVVKIAGTGYPTVNLGESSTLALGESVFAVGNALGQYNNSVSVGVISGLNRDITAQDANGTTETLDNVIQTDAAINPGNSGGPLVDLNGNVIGINVATAQGSQSIGFALPIDEIKSALTQLGI
jgi:serine protease Do